MVRGRPGVRTAAKAALWLAAAAAGAALLLRLDAGGLLRGFLAWVEGLGPAGGLVFMGVYILATVLFLPGSVLTLGAGFLFGVVKGSVIVSVASTAGAAAAFLIGRYLARDWVAAKLEGRERFEAIDDAVAAEGWRVVGLLRLSPVFPFNLLNYALGLTRVSFREYLLASWVGMMPGTVMYVYFGSLAGDLASLGAGGRARTPAEWTLYAAGLLATLIVTVRVTRVARAALKKRIEV